MEQGIPIKAGIFRMKAEGPEMDVTRYRLTPGVRAETLHRLQWPGTEIRHMDRFA